MKTLEKQYLIEYQTEADCVQLRLDEYWPEMPPKSLIEEWYKLLDRINELTKRKLKMNKNNFTPGKWSAQYFTDSTTLIKAENHNKAIAEVRGTNIKANAALIAASPEMFEVLQLIGTIANVSLETDSDYKNRMKRISEHASEIIKKARGE